MRLSLILTFVLSLAGVAFAAEERLSDRVFFVRDKPGSPTKFQMIVNAGCHDEAAGQCLGLAHYLEHIVLVGRNPEHKDSAVRMFAGASANGWTNQRATVYIHTIAPKEGPATAELEQLFGFYAARLKDFTITDEDAARERNVVLQEHDVNYASSPYRLFYRDLYRKLLPDHVSGQWTIGTQETIKAFTTEQARAFHKNWYVINNVWFVVSGDLEPAAVKAIAEKALAGLEARALPPRNFSHRPEVPNELIEDQKADVRVKQPGAIVYKLVRMPERDIIENRAQRRLLGAFLASQLPGSPYVVLNESKKLTSGRIFTSIERVAPETFVISLSASTAPDVDRALLRTELAAYLNGLGDNAGMSDEAFARLKKRITLAQEEADEDPRRVFSRLIDWLANRNDYAELARWPERLQAVEPAAVRDMAKAFAGPGRTIVATIGPEAKP